MSLYIAGLDLGTQVDYSAIAILERVEAPPEPVLKVLTTANMHEEEVPRKAAPASYHCRWISRWPLKSTYPRIIEDVRVIMSSPVFKGRDSLGKDDSIVLVVDATGCGRPVCDVFSQAGLRLIPITITAGNKATFEGGEWHVPKRDLVSVVSVLLQSGRLKLSSELPESQTLIQEMLNFQVRISASGNDQYASWRDRDHDDTVLALAVAAYYGERVGNVGSIRGIPKASLWHSVPAFESPWREKGWL